MATNNSNITTSSLGKGKNLRFGTSKSTYVNVVKKDGTPRVYPVVKSDVFLNKYRLEDSIFKVVKKMMKDPDWVPPTEPTTDEDEKAKKKNKLKTLGMSVQAITIASRTIMSGNYTIAEAKASTDNVALKRTMANFAITGTTAVLAMIPTMTTRVLATLLATGNFFFGNAIQTNIQRKGDLGRMKYNFKNLDYGKLGTQVYDYTQGYWVAEDVKKINKKYLKQNASV